LTPEIWVADSETDPFDYDIIPKPFLWGLYNGVDYYEFTDTNDFVDFVSARDIVVYAHNGGKFDWHFISHRFEVGTPILVIAGRLSRFTIGKCEFRDSINIYAKPLEAFNKEKFDYAKMEVNVRHLYMEEIKTYLKSDCENLYALVTGFIAEYGFNITTASAAMKFWRQKLPSGRNKIPRSDGVFYDTFKRFFFGGRVQCFEQGDIKINALSADINSAYPNAMMQNHPYGLIYGCDNGKPRKKPDKWGPMFFDIEAVAHGAFCYRGTDGALYYPDDKETRIYHVTGWELLAAIETDTADKIKILQHYEFDELKSFSEYIDYFWEKRLEFKAAGDKHGSDFAKLMMNSLFGKFASDVSRYKENFLVAKDEFYSEFIHGPRRGEPEYGLHENDSWHEFREWVIVSREQDTSKKKFFNLATAASITGFNRAKLWRAICECERPLYCDTDSITAVSFNEKKSVTIGSELGEWEIEHHYDRVAICGKKLYAFHERGEKMKDAAAWKIARKGSRLEFADILKVANGQTVNWRSIAPSFSVAKSEPQFIRRDIKATAGDSRHVPRRYDPKYREEK
jgi:DNA polymerase elongation subunit (family B)